MIRSMEPNAPDITATCSTANSARHSLHELKQRVAQQKLQTFLALEALAVEQFGDTNEQGSAAAPAQTVTNPVEPLHPPPKAVPLLPRKKAPETQSSDQSSPACAQAPVRCPSTLIPVTEASPLTPTFRPLGPQKGRSRRTGPRPSVEPVTPTPFAANSESPIRKVRFSSVLNARSPSPAISPQRVTLAGSDSCYSDVPTDHAEKSLTSTNSVTELVVQTTTAVARDHRHSTIDAITCGGAVAASDETDFCAETVGSTKSQPIGLHSDDETEAPDALSTGHGPQLPQPIYQKTPNQTPPLNTAVRAKIRHKNVTIRQEMVRLNTQIEDLVQALESKTMLCQALEAELASVRAENDALRAMKNSPAIATNHVHAPSLVSSDSKFSALQTSSEFNNEQRRFTLQRTISPPDHSHHLDSLPDYWTQPQAKLIKVCDALGLDHCPTNRQETLHSNGKLEWYLPRHTTTVLAYPDGNVKVISTHPPKHTLIFANGDVQESFDQDHRLVYFYTDANVRHTQNGLDQTELWEYLDDGYAERWYPDGRKETVSLLHAANQ
ncbi:hypothetical protein H4R35_000245 [Dimargaris xerosporica]|nr:hypothetical protein H4R35_000245 [Dimargaris xerosporica]